MLNNKLKPMETANLMRIIWKEINYLKLSFYLAIKNVYTTSSILHQGIIF